MEYSVKKHDDVLNGVYNFQIFGKSSNEKIEDMYIDFFINDMGLIFLILNDKNSRTFGLREYMNLPLDFQECLLSEYKRFLELRRELHSVDE